MAKRNSKAARKMAQNNDLRHGRHCTFLIHAHLVFVTKYRKGVLTGPMLDRLKIIFAGVAAKFEAEIVEFEGERDHVHLLINYPPKHALSKIVNSLKGVSSRLLRKDFGLDLRKKLWGSNLWSASYFAGSCGGAPLAKVKVYIQSQQRPD
jgi:putative transposase